MTPREAAPVEEDWVVCMGETREVLNGRVMCPRSGGGRVPVEECSSCRFLAWRHDERDARFPCDTELNGGNLR
jgi:hypothetical protein